MKSKIEIALRDVLYALEKQHNGGKPIPRSQYLQIKMKEAKLALKEEENKRKKNPVQCG